MNPYTTAQTGTLTIDSRQLPINGQRNVLEMAREAGIEIPTFCYHSELSVYGACRLCLVEVEGRGIVTSCSTAPEPGMVVRTNTHAIRKLRRVAVELLLANHDASCQTCNRSDSCKLRGLAARLGVHGNRLDSVSKKRPLDLSSLAVVRDPNRCVLCGDCVRVCDEVQGIGAIDFVGRGHDTHVGPPFGLDLSEVQCVDCGQCAAVCPVGAITPKVDISPVWKALEDPKKTVVVSFAPAVRVAIGEAFGMEPGTLSTGKMVAALRFLGFDKVFDTAYAADLTVLEEGNELIQRIKDGGPFPLFTSCCPAWVKLAELRFPELLNKLSSCNSPQQIQGVVTHKILPKLLDIAPEDLVSVSVMPCTAKKAEAALPKNTDPERQKPYVDHVITTQELVQMINIAGLRFQDLTPASLDLPFGYKTGAGLLFGSSGGVTEAVLRLLPSELGEPQRDTLEFKRVRGEQGVRRATVQIGGHELKLAVVHGLKEAQKLARRVINGEEELHFVEVMACPGGCVAGAGQPHTQGNTDARRMRITNLQQGDTMLQLHRAQENHLIHQLYREELEKPGSHKAHEWFHTHYRSRERIHDTRLQLNDSKPEATPVRVCVGTNCHTRGAQMLLHDISNHIDANDLEADVELQATFCFEACADAPNVQVGDELISHADFDKIKIQLAKQCQGCRES